MHFLVVSGKAAIFRLMNHYAMELRKEHILVVDDDQAILTTAQLFLEDHFAYVGIEAEPSKLQRLIQKHTFDVILLDMNYRRGRMDGGEGLHWLEKCRQWAPNAAIVLMTAYGDVDLAVEAMKIGAFDFVVKPWKNARLLSAIMGAANFVAQAANKAAPDSIGHSSHQVPPTAEMLGNSTKMQYIRAMISKVAPTDASVLITGENGTGKEIVARQLHKQSLRKDDPFVPVDMGALPDTLIENELFGSQKGAFTDAREDKKGRFVLANQGTLFLDEIANLPPDKQSVLLKALEDREITPLGAAAAEKVDIRLITATHQSLEQLIAAGRFRQDLYYRINTFIIELPPLRQRLEDLASLVPYFFNRFCKQHNKSCTYGEESFIKALQQHPWPGNIRELRNVLERTVVLADDGACIDYPALPSDADTRAAAIPDDLNLQAHERYLVEQALSRSNGNVSKAAKMLGIDRNALYRRMKKYGIQ